MILDERVRAELATSTRFHDVRWMASTGSTNRVVADLAQAGAAEGVVVGADFQTAGRGRLDRSWESSPGEALLVSVLLRPGLAPERWHLVTAAAALAARAACTEAAGVTPSLKWPNDLLVGESKLAGILAEAHPGAVVVGMGLNVHGGPPGSAVLDREAGRTVCRGQVLERWLVGLDRRLGDWHGVAEEYRRDCATVGRAVAVELLGGDRLEGMAEGTDRFGRLLVRTADGTSRAVTAGDVTHLR